MEWLREFTIGMSSYRPSCPIYVYEHETLCFVEVADLYLRRYLYDCLRFIKNNLHLPERLLQKYLFPYVQVNLQHNFIEISLEGRHEMRKRLFRFEGLPQQNYEYLINKEIDTLLISGRYSKDNFYALASITWTQAYCKTYNRKDFNRSKLLKQIIVVLEPEDKELWSNILVYEDAQKVILCQKFNPACYNLSIPMDLFTKSTYLE